MITSNCKVICSTQDTYDGDNLCKVWQSEVDRVVTLRKQLSYDFPQLEVPKYQETMKEGSKCTICQEIFWSKDSTSFITVHSDFGIRQFLRPDDITTIDSLTPYTRVFTTESVISAAAHQDYSLYDSNPGNLATHCILIGSRNVPIKLINLETTEKLETVVSYNIMNQENEKYEVPYSLKFVDTSPQFVAGSTRNKVSLFDITRRDPVTRYSYNRKGRCGTTSYKSVISCFDRGDRVIMCGSYKTQLFRIDTRSKERMEMVYRSATRNNTGGYYQLINTHNGNYLYCFRRNSDKIDIFDVRSQRLLNQFQLPYTTNKKLKASYNSELAIGTPHGNIISWETSTVEAAGISRDNKIETCHPDTTHHIPKGMINIVAESPDSQVYAVSHSPSTECQSSGLALLLR